MNKHDYEVALCDKCNWQGIVGDCQVEVEQEGQCAGEETLVCPKCGSHYISF